MECYPTYRIISQEFLELLKGHFKIKQAYKKIIWLLKQNGAWIISLFTILYNVDSAELSIFVLFFSLRCLLDNHIFISTTEYNFSFVMNAIPARIVQINIMTYFLYILFFFFTLMVSIIIIFINITNLMHILLIYASITFVITFIMFKKYMVS